MNKCLEILEEMENLECDIPYKGIDFYDEVMETARSICENVEKRENETDSQIIAMENMLAGIYKWIN